MDFDMDPDYNVLEPMETALSLFLDLGEGRRDFWEFMSEEPRPICEYFIGDRHLQYFIRMFSGRFGGLLYGLLTFLCILLLVVSTIPLVHAKTISYFCSITWTMTIFVSLWLVFIIVIYRNYFHTTT